VIIVTIHPGFGAARIVLRQLTVGLHPDIQRQAKSVADALDILQGMLDDEVVRPGVYE
jgi:hypothetical protein